MVGKTTAKKDKKCTKCGKCFAQTGHLNRHMLLHTEERPFKCSQCDKTYRRADELKAHMYLHEDPKTLPFPCPTCDKAFGTEPLLARHGKVHTKPKPHSCEDCDESFTKKFQLARHRSIHTGKSAYICPEEGCGASFGVPSLVKRHQLRNHTLNTYLCQAEGCMEEPFGKFSELQRHLSICHKDRVYECEKCGKRYGSASSLRKHKPIHEQLNVDRFIHQCGFPGCAAVYPLSSSLAKHVSTRHLNRDRFSCEICKRNFSEKGSLKRHVRKIHGDEAKQFEPKFFCRVCEKGYATRAVLRRHLRVSHKQSFNAADGDELTEAGNPESRTGGSTNQDLVLSEAELGEDDPPQKDQSAKSQSNSEKEVHSRDNAASKPPTFGSRSEKDTSPEAAKSPVSLVPSEISDMPAAVQDASSQIDAEKFTKRKRGRLPDSGSSPNASKRRRAVPSSQLSCEPQISLAATEPSNLSKQSQVRPEGQPLGA